MKKLMIMIIVAACLVQAASADIWQDLIKYKNGDEEVVPDKIEALMKATAPDQYGPIEDAFIKVLETKEATADAKKFALEKLQQVGTEKSVSVVAGFLNDDLLSDYARLVLEPMTESETAGEALSAALEKASANAKIGIIASIGERRDKKAVSKLGKLLSGGDAKIIQAALIALGKIGDSKAAKVLRKAEVPEGLKIAKLGAQLSCARGLTESDDKAAACKILYDIYSGDNPKYIQLASLKGLVNAGYKKANALIAESLKSDDQVRLNGVYGIIAATSGTELTKTVCKLLADVDPSKQIRLIDALGERGDSLAAEHVAKYARSENKELRSIALRSTGKLGAAATVQSIIEIADVKTPFGREVIDVISRMEDPKINEALITMLNDGKSAIPVMRIMKLRVCKEAFAAVLTKLDSDDYAVRKEAWYALQDISGPDSMTAMMKKMVARKERKDMANAENCLKKYCGRMQDKKKCMDIAAEFYTTGDENVKMFVLTISSVAGDKKALGIVRAALESGNDKLYGKAVRSLAAWSNSSAAPALLSIAKDSSDEVVRIIALKGYINVTGIDESNPSREVKVSMYKTAYDLATRSDEQKLVVSGLAKIKTADSFKMLAGYLQNVAIKQEVIAGMMGQLSSIGSDPSILPLVIALQQEANEKDKENISTVITNLNIIKEAVRTWLSCGKYEMPGMDKDDIFNKAFAPENPNDQSVKWEKVTKGIGSTSVSLSDLYGGEECCAYLKTTVIVPEDIEAKLVMGSDDAIKAWVNDKLVHENNANRGCRLGDDSTNITLKKGDNTLLLKIVQGGGGWEGACAILTTAGFPIEGLTIEAR